MQKSIVQIKNEDVFTDSKVIAEGTNNQHHTITRLIRTYKNQFKELGKVGFKIHALASGQKTKIYQLNEPQATFLMTLLKNSPVVIEFKLRLTQEFYRMRMMLLSRKNSGWLETRQNGKMIRRSETDAIQQLIDYAIAQGSEHAEKLYLTYTRMVNSFVGLSSGDRASAPIAVLTTLAFIENVVMHTIIEEMAKGTYYKDIFKASKNKVEHITGLAYLPESRLMLS